MIALFSMVCLVINITPCSAENDERKRVGFPLKQLVMTSNLDEIIDAEMLF